ncbi:MAG TPA: PH domain-containing protein [Lacipirellulaceae bacterium]|nr:PH domain-containing protein [Lacipirellulaceae bacterium]
MKQPVAGVAPAQLQETTVMVVWPSLSATGFGRFWGRLFGIDAGFPVFGVPITVGRLFALVSIPFMVALYFLMRLPRFPGIVIGIKNPWCWQYRLTNRRVVVENPFGGEIKAVSLDRFDAIDIVVESGQAWFKAGDLVFRHGATETFRIWGVPRPETFRHTCLKANMSFVGVQKAKAAGVAV